MNVGWEEDYRVHHVLLYLSLESLQCSCRVDSEWEPEARACDLTNRLHAKGLGTCGTAGCETFRARAGE